MQLMHETYPSLSRTQRRKKVMEFLRGVTDDALVMCGEKLAELAP